MEAGVDSLAATELVRRLWQLSAKPLPTTLLFECPTVSAIVGRILGQEAPSAETARVRRGAELSAAGIEDERVHVQVRVRGSYSSLTLSLTRSLTSPNSFHDTCSARSPHAATSTW